MNEQTNHVYTYIHTYMEKRKREEDTKNTNVIFYSGKDLKTIKHIAFVNNTDVSSIVSNLIREFNLLIQSTTPQRTLFNFEERPVLHFDTERKQAYQYLLSLSPEEFRDWSYKLQMWNELEKRVTSKR